MAELPTHIDYMPSINSAQQHKHVIMKYFYYVLLIL